MKSYIDHILAERPTRAQTVESMLLRINDLPGYAFRTVGTFSTRGR
jgi:hypothetical protein